MQNYIFILFLLFIGVINCQWFKVNNGGPAEYTTEPSAMPQPRYNGLFWCEGDDLYLYGGMSASSGLLRDFWKFETETNRWLWLPDAPHELDKAHHEAAWTALGKLWVYLDNKILQYHPTDRTWQYITTNFSAGTAPISWAHLPSDSAYIYDTETTALYRFNVETYQSEQLETFNLRPGIGSMAALGYNENTVYVFNQNLFTLDLNTLTWCQDTNYTDKRENANMWLSPSQEKLLLFGGKIGAEVLSNPMQYTLESQTWGVFSRGGGPNARWGAMTCTDEKGTTYLFGGTSEDTTQANNDLWKFGPPNKQNILDILNFELNSTSLASYMAAIFSGLVLLILLIFCVLVCVKKCREQCGKHIFLKIVPERLNSAFEIEDENSIIDVL